MKSVVRMSVLALSLAAAGAAQAQSSVTLYGSLDVGIGYSSEGGKAGLTVNSGQYTTSFFGLKGSEDLGNGYKTIFDLQSFFRVDNGQSGRTTNAGEAFFSKSAYVGLSAPWGTAVAGRVGTPFGIAVNSFNAFGGSSAFNPTFRQIFSGSATVLGSFANGVGNTPGRGGGNDAIYDNVWNNAIRYVSPSFNGLTLSLIGAPGEVVGYGGRFNIGASAHYTNGPLAAVVAFQRNSFGIMNESSQPDGGSLYGWNGATNTAAALATTGYQSAFLAGGSYDLKFAKLFSQYAYIYNDVTSLPGQRSQGDQLFSISANVPFGTGYFSGAWGRDYKQGLQVAGTTLLAKGHRDTISFAYNYPLSKRTDVYAGYRYDGWDNVGTNFTSHLITTGLRTFF